MKDVARHANVSLGTVSRIVNGHAPVDPELRKHVEKVIRDLGYRHNATARALRTRRTKAIGIIVTDLRQQIAAQLVAAASDVARSKGCAPIVCDFLNDVQDEETLLRFMAERSVDGLLLTTGSDENPQLVETLQAPSCCGSAMPRASSRRYAAITGWAQDWRARPMPASPR